MQTNFSLTQLSQPNIKEMDSILRSCVHCGFCLSACPTYNILGDERDSPRGRIYLIKELIEQEGRNSKMIVPHLDKCLSCLACSSICPSGVDYQHYIDFARSYAETRVKRHLGNRVYRWLVGKILTNPTSLRIVVVAGVVLKLFEGILGSKFSSALRLLPERVGRNRVTKQPHTYRSKGKRRLRVSLLAGCAQQVLSPSINEATIRLLTRLGCDVVLPRKTGCCGALIHHLGQEKRARSFAKKNVEAWMNEITGKGLDAIVTNASGCGTEIKDYKNLLKYDDGLSEGATLVSSLTRDITELLAELGLQDFSYSDLPEIVYHDSCSLLHGQKIREKPRDLLKQVGFVVKEIPGSHFCCGSAGSYNIFQPELAGKLQNQRVAAIQQVGAEIVATGNIGCQVQLQQGLDIPVVHTVELLDWGTGGPVPDRVKHYHSTTT